MEFKIGKYLSPIAYSLLSTVLLTGADAAVAAGEDATDQLIVGFDSASANGEFRAFGLAKQINKNLVYIRTTATGGHVYRLPSKEELPAVRGYAKALQAVSGVQFAEADQIMKLVALETPPTDSLYADYHWHYKNNAGGINAPGAWAQFDTPPTNPVYVAVLDTGYRPHGDLLDNLATDGNGDVFGADMIGVYSSVDVANDGDGRDMDPIDPGDWMEVGECGQGQPLSFQRSSWHGTHVAGTIAGETHNGGGISGVTYNMAKVIPVRVLGTCGGYLSDIADGIIWASGGTVEGMPSNPYPAKVINMSLGGSGSCGTTYQAAIDQAVAAGTTVVVSAGNSGANAGNYRPASCNDVVTVAATDVRGERAYYSNYGSVVDIAAPGGGVDSADGVDGYVWSTLNSGDRGPVADNYAGYAGTSMSAPHVSGVAALMLLKDKQLSPTGDPLSPAAVEGLLKVSARAFPTSCAECGAGLLDAGNAVASVGNVEPPTLPVIGSLYGDGLTTGSATLTWDDSANETSYQLQRQKKNRKKWSGWADIYAPAQDQTLYQDASGAGTFRYRIRAENSVGASDWSNDVQVDVADGSGGDTGGGKPDKPCRGKNC